VVALINRNARRTRDGLHARLARVAPGQVRITGSLDEARAVLHDEVGRGVDLVVFAGGDGTVVMGLAMLAEACRGHARPEPAVGVLRLGSGNAIADAVGATRDPADDLARLVRGDGAWRTTAMIDVLGVRAPFVGMGVDAQLLEDHEAVSRVVDRVPGAKRLVGTPGHPGAFEQFLHPRGVHAEQPRLVAEVLPPRQVAIEEGLVPEKTYPPAHRDEVASTFAVMAAAMRVEACGGTAEAIALAARWTGKITARSGRAVIARDASAA